MRKKLLIATTAGALTLTGLAVAVPALAEDSPGRATEAGVGDHRGGHGGRLDLAAAATALDLTEEELRAALEPEGTTLAQVAEDHDVPVGTLVDALVQAQEERIAQAVEDGRLTQEEADERLADLEERVIERVTTAVPPHGGGHRGGHGSDGPAGD